MLINNAIIAANSNTRPDAASNLKNHLNGFEIYCIILNSFMKLDISLYIPVYNGESTIERVLKSALKLDPGPNEIIVINDGSTDDTFSKY